MVRAARRLPDHVRGGVVLNPRSLRGPALVGGGILVAALVLSFVATNVYASVGQRHLSDRMNQALARWAPLDPVERGQIAFATGDPVARITAPSIGLDVVAAEGATPGVMRRALGHLPGSVVPGDQGVAIITGNRFGFGSYFLRLGNLAVGDRIITESAFGRTTYTVMEVRTVPADNMNLDPASEERVLVLFGSGRVWGGGDRIVVRAVADPRTQG